MVALNPPAKAEAPELPPKVLKAPPVLAELASAAANGAVAAGAAAFPNAGNSEVGGGGAAAPKAATGVNVLLAEAADCAAAGAPCPPKMETVCLKGDAALLLAPNKEVEPRDDARDPTPRDDC